MLNKDLASNLKEIVGSKSVLDDEFVRWSYYMDSNIFEVLDRTLPVVERVLDSVAFLCR